MDNIDSFWSGKLEPLLSDHTISTIMVNDLNKIFVVKNNQMVLSNFSFHTEEELEEFTHNLLKANNQTVEEYKYNYNFRSQDGSRIHIIIPPVSSKTTITIQKFSTQKLTMQDLINNDTLSEQEHVYLTNAIRNKKNIIISGGTGSGKTTLLNTLIPSIPEEHPIVAFEDSAELEINKTHFIRYETFKMKEEETSQLINFIFAMPTPKTLLFGEVRNGTALDIVNGLSNNEKNGMMTVHSNEPENALERLYLLATQHPNNRFSEVKFKNKLADSIDIVVQIHRLKSGKRSVTKIIEPTGFNKDLHVFEYKTIFHKE